MQSSITKILTNTNNVINLDYISDDD